MAKDFREGGESKAAVGTQSGAHAADRKLNRTGVDTSGMGIAVAVAASVLASSAVAQSDAVPDGFVLLTARFRIEKARVLSDGTLELTYLNGAKHLLAADDFVLLSSGAVSVRETEVDALLLLGEKAAADGGVVAPVSDNSEQTDSGSDEASAVLGGGDGPSSAALGVGLGALAAISAAVGGASSDTTAPDAPVNVALSDTSVLTFTAETGSIAKIFNDGVDISTKFDISEAGGQFSAIAKLSEFGGEPLVITVTVTDAAGNESLASSAIQGTIGSGLGLPFAKGLFLMDAFTLTAKDADGNEVFKFDSEGNFTSDPDVGASFDVETIELDGETFVRGFDLRFETFSGTLALYLEDDGVDTTPTFLNEADGELVNLKTTLRAFAEVPEGGYGLASITPFTEIAVRLWEQATGKTFEDSGAASDADISMLRDAYGLVSEIVGFDVGSEKPVVTDDPGFKDAGSESQLYGLKLAAFSSMLDDDPNVAGDINVEGGIENLIGTKAQPKIIVGTIDGKVQATNFEEVLNARVSLTDALVDLVEDNPDLGGESQPISAERPEAPTLNVPDSVNINQSELSFSGTVNLKEGEELFVSFSGSTFKVTDIIDGAWRLEPLGLEPRTGLVINAVNDGAYDVVAFVTNASGNSTRDSGTVDGNIAVLVDRVSPDAPINVALSGDTLTFTAEAGSTPMILDGTSDVTSSFTITESNGSFTAVAKVGVFDGSEQLSVTVTATDAAGNESDPSSAVTGSLDSTAPDAPINVALSGDTLTFTAEAGSTPTILDGATDITSDFTITESNGSFTAVAKTDEFDGSENLSVTVTATDAAANESAPSTAATGRLDSTAPDAPTNVVLSGDTLTFTAEAGSTPTILDGTSDITSDFTITESNGSFTAVAKVGVFDGSEQLSVTVTATDAAGNESDPSSAVTGSLDSTAPDAPINVALSGDTLTFTAEASSTATILDGTSDVTSSFAITESNGSFTAVAKAGAFDGSENLSVTVIATDAAGNESDPSTAVTGSLDSTAPDAPINTALNGDTLTFTAEAGSSPTILDGTSDVTSSFTISESSGSFTAVAKAGAFDGSENLSMTVTATDAAGNESDPSSAVTGSIDSTAPDAPTNVALSGDTLTFAAEAGSTATILDGTSDITSDFTITESNGSFTAVAKVGVFDGSEKLSVAVTATDAAGNESDPGALTGSMGFVINGVTDFDSSGFSVSSAGDVNGDGLADLIVGARSADPNGLSSGASYVIFGKSDGSIVELSDIAVGTNTDGFVINGVTDSDQSGVSVSSAGDVNGDGLADLIVGAQGADPNGTSSGASYVVFGKSDGSIVELSDIAVGTNTDGFVINGVTNTDLSGRAVSGAGDVNGDGLADLIVGAPFDGPNGNNSGASYVIFGKSDGSVVELSDLESGVNTDGFVINGVTDSDQSGFSVSSAGDVNGDGLADLIVGAFSADPNGTSSGAAYVIFGKSDGSVVELSDIAVGTNTDGFVINGVTDGDQAGFSVSSAGDVNGDGLDDLIVGANLADPNGSSSGASYVIFGKSDGSVVELSDVADGTNTDGFVINGVTDGDKSGVSVSSAGDVNGDGLDDLIVGAHAAQPNGSYSGASYVIFGKTDGSVVELSDVADGTNADGFVINGVTDADFSGRSVSSAGDVNGDGLADLIVGAYLADPNGSFSGASYVIFGKTDGSAVELGDVTAGVVRIDTTAPDAPTNVLLSGATLTFTAETGTTATILDGTSDITSDFTITESSGSFTAVAKAGEFDGSEQLSVTVIATDAVGNESDPSTTVTGSLDSTAPDAPTNVLLIGATLTFTAESGTTPTILDGTSDITSDFTITESNGSFTAVAKAGEFDGSESLSVTVTATDAAGNESDPGAIGPTGFVINGVAAEDYAGWSVSTAGDVNGDGVVDLIVGAYGADPNGSYSGASYVIFGKSDGSTVELSDVAVGTNTDGFVINGVTAGDEAGYSVSSAGDVNGDGLADLIVGADVADPNGSSSGASYVIFGKSDGAVVELSDIEDSANTDGFVINGVTDFDSAGLSVSSAGDVNGDGLADLIVGAFGADTNGSDSGASYVIFGKSDGSVVELSDIASGTNVDGFVINGVTDGDNSGASVSSAGDVNGDGLADLIVAASRADPNGSFSGANYVIFGKSDGSTVELSDIASGTNTDGFVINGVTDFDQAGGSVSSAGDVNGDGLDDLIVGADGADPNGSRSGASYVIFGKSDGSVVELSDIADGTNTDGFVINGVTDGDRAGASVSSAGDVNGDGLADLIVGAWGAGPNGSWSGASYVIFGKSDGSVVELSDVAIAANSDGFVINGATDDDSAGFSVSSAGDMNGDGLADLIVGAYGADPNGSKSGASYVVFGKTDGSAVELGDVTAGVVRIDTTAPDAPTNVLLSGATLTFTAESGTTPTILDGTSDITSDFTITESSGSFTAVAKAGVFDVLTVLDGFTVSVTDGAGNESARSRSGPMGFVVYGEDDEQLGSDVSIVGDVNGDGFDDLLIGADAAFVNQPGSAYVVFGASTNSVIQASDIKSGSGLGFAIGGGTNPDYLGAAVSAAGDVNGDGLADLVIGAPYSSLSAVGEAGAAYIVFGKTNDDTVTLSDIESGRGGFVLIGGSDGDEFGYSVSGGRDINGDGLDDLLVGAGAADSNGNNFSGTSYVVFGKTDTSPIEVSSIGTGSDGFLINGVTLGDFSGSAVSIAGDINGDGLVDLIISAPFADPNGNNSGTSYVVFGKTSTANVDLSSLTSGVDGFLINGGAIFNNLGYSVSGAGDVNGDGYDDLLVGEINEGDKGAAYIIFGSSSPTDVEVSNLSAGEGIKFNNTGLADFDNVGYSVSSAGDLNGDGIDDVVVGAPWSVEGTNFRSGAAYVVFGETGILSVELTDVANGIGGFKIVGVSDQDNIGEHVSGGGDVNGDGFDDLIIGAPYSSGGTYAGASYVIYGGNLTGAVSETGTTGDDTLSGTSADDVIFAGLGDDVLDGGGGADRLSGGAGADTFVVRDLSGTTTVIDFNGGQGDQLDVSAFGLADFNAFKALLSPDGVGDTDTLITLDSDTSVLLENITPDAIVQSHVLLS